MVMMCFSGYLEHNGSVYLFSINNMEAKNVQLDI